MLQVYADGGFATVLKSLNYFDYILFADEFSGREIAQSFSF